MSDLPLSSSSIDTRISSTPASFTARNHTADAATTSWTQVDRHPKRSPTLTSGPAPPIDVEQGTAPGARVHNLGTGNSQLQYKDEVPQDGRFRIHVITSAPPLLPGADPHEGHTDPDGYIDAYWGGDIKATPRADDLTVEEMVQYISGILDGKMTIHDRGPNIPNICIAGTHIDHRPRADEPEEAEAAKQRRHNGTPSNPQTRDTEAPGIRALRGGRFVGTGINRRPVIFATMAYKSLGPHLRFSWRTKAIRELDPSRAPIPGGIYVLTKSLRRPADFDEDETVLDLILPILDPHVDGTESLAFQRAWNSPFVLEQHEGTANPSAQPSEIVDPASPAAETVRQSASTPPTPCPLPSQSAPLLRDKGKDRETDTSRTLVRSPLSPTARRADRPLSMAIRALKFQKVPRAATAGPPSASSLSDIIPSARKRARTDDPYAEPSIDYEMTFEEPAGPSPLHPPFTLVPHRQPAESPAPSQQDGAHSSTPSSIRLFQSGQEAETVNEDFGELLDHLDDSQDVDATTHLTPRPRPNGFPPIHGDDPYFLFRGVPSPTRTRWIKEPTPKLVGQVWGTGLGHKEAHLYGDKTVALLEKKYRVTGIKYLLVNRSPPTKPTEAPFSMLLYGFTEDIRTEAVNYKVFSIPGFTLILYPLAWSVPTYMCTLTGFSTNETAAIREAMYDRILQPNVGNIITDMKPTHPRLAVMTDHNAHTDTAQTLEVIEAIHHGPGGTPFLAWGIYLRPPTQRAAEGAKFRARMRGLNFGNDVVGYGSILEIRQCTGCHGADHSRGMCPFTSVPGWNGTTPEEQRRADAAAAARARREAYGWNDNITQRRGGPSRGSFGGRRGQGRGRGHVY